MTKKVSIIGGSAAGLFAAHLLAKDGSHVRVFEAKADIDPPRRTLIVTHQASELIGPICEPAVVNKIRRFELFADGRVATVSLNQPDLVIERSRLIRLLARQAESSGAEINTGHRFLDLCPNGGKLRFTLAANGEARLRREEAEVLVGADGTFSRVARRGHFKKYPSVTLLQAVVRLPGDMQPDATRVWFLPKWTPFFFWLIPHSPTHGVLGLIAEETNQGRVALEDFIQAKGLHPEEIQHGLIPLYDRWTPVHRRVGEGDIYLVGDAAGHVKPTTVGGLVTGFRGVMGVVEAILGQAGRMRLYNLRAELAAHSMIRRALHGFTQSDYARLLDLLRPEVVQRLAHSNRDQSGNLLMSLCAREPRILSMGLCSLINALFTGKRR